MFAYNTLKTCATEAVGMPRAVWLPGRPSHGSKPVCGNPSEFPKVVKVLLGVICQIRPQVAERIHAGSKPFS